MTTRPAPRAACPIIRGFTAASLEGTRRIYRDSTLLEPLGKRGVP
ncbi:MULTISPECIES: hypothetical protein [Actinomadura]|nr:hypothetical protein [Actinomadura geliboluensis]